MPPYRMERSCTMQKAPENGNQPLLLIHGQTGAWQDYASVLPKLCQSYHVFVLDCHGHGKSSKGPEKYSAMAMCKDFAWFLSEVAGGPAVVSGSFFRAVCWLRTWRE